jgi:hypothetical protein
VLLKGSKICEWFSGSTDVSSDRTSDSFFKHVQGTNEFQYDKILVTDLQTKVILSYPNAWLTQLCSFHKCCLAAELSNNQEVQIVFKT